MGKEEKEAASIINRSLTLNTTIVLLKRKRERETMMKWFSIWSNDNGDAPETSKLFWCVVKAPKDLQHLFAGCSIGLLYWLSLVILEMEGRKKEGKKKDWFVIFVLNESCIHVALFIQHTYAWRGRKTLMPKRGELQPCLKEHYQKGMHAQCYYQTFMLKDEKRDDRICQSFLLLHAVILITWWDSCLLHFWCHCCFLLLSGNDVLGPAKRTAIWGQILAKSGSSSWWGENEFLWARSFFSVTWCILGLQVERLFFPLKGGNVANCCTECWKNKSDVSLE